MEFWHIFQNKLALKFYNTYKSHVSSAFNHL